MTSTVAKQIAKLLNTQNKLARHYTAKMILDDQDRYVVYCDEKQREKVLGALEIKRVQWYQCEIDHVTVDPKLHRKGIGSKLLKKAESQAIFLGARITQCTIRVGNLESENFFKKHGYAPSVTFFNQPNRRGNNVTVYQKALTLGPPAKIPSGYYGHAATRSRKAQE
jgi:ribosomal protein S18 acetylase RimI-like enzyme